MDGVLLGTDTRTVDNKGRFIVPSHYKHIPGEKMVLILNDNYIEAREYDKVINKLKDIMLKLNDAPSIDMVNFYQDEKDLLTSSIKNVIKLDKQGRFLLGIDIVKKYNITDQVIIEGVVDAFRIWNPDKFREYKEEKMGKKSRR